MASIKFNLDKEVRRASYSHTKEDPLTFGRLKTMAVKLFPTLEGKEFHLCYRDDENDLVTFSSDEELNEAIKSMLPKSTTLKFAIVLGEGEKATSSSSNGKGAKKNSGVVLPSSLSPQEAVAASALLSHNPAADEDDSSVSSDEHQQQPAPAAVQLTTPSTSRNSKKRTRDSLDSLPPGADVIGEPSSMADLDSNPMTPGGGIPDHKRRQSYSLQDKLSLLKEYHEVNLSNKKPMKQFAFEHNINQKTFSSWMKEYQEGKLQNLHLTPDNKRIRLRKAEYPEIENLLIQFIETYDPNQTVSWSLIRTYALKYAKEYLKPEELANFKASDGWIQNFLRRNNIILHRRGKATVGGVGGSGVGEGGEGGNNNNNNTTSSSVAIATATTPSSSSSAAAAPAAVKREDANPSTIAASDDESEDSSK
jgi:transposase-like protein